MNRTGDCSFLEPQERARARGVELDRSAVFAWQGETETERERPFKDSPSIGGPLTARGSDQPPGPCGRRERAMTNLQSSHVPSKPQNTWGANKPGNLNSPLSTVVEGYREREREREGERERERERERKRERERERERDEREGPVRHEPHFPSSFGSVTAPMLTQSTAEGNAAQLYLTLTRTLGKKRTYQDTRKGAQVCQGKATRPCSGSFLHTEIRGDFFRLHVCKLMPWALCASMGAKFLANVAKRAARSGAVE